MSEAAPPLPPTVAIVSAGSMGARIGEALVSRGVPVLTSVQGRSATTRDRAMRAGMRIVSPELLGSADFVLSVVRSDRAVHAARMMVSAGAFEQNKPLYVDCNPVSADTLDTLAQLLSAAGCGFVDACILGGSAEHGAALTCRLVASGPFASRLNVLNHYGLVTHVIDGPIGVASALRMCVSGTNKGLIAVLTLMIALAARAGVAVPLREELERMHSVLLAWISQQTVRLCDTADRWSAEMRELARSLPEESGGRIAAEIADFYSTLATSPRHAKELAAALNDFFHHQH